MIMVDIYFPVVDCIYDFRLDEHSQVNALIREISEMMCKKYKSAFTKETYMLCSLDSNEILDGNTPLWEHGLKNGSRLMMV